MFKDHFVVAKVKQLIKDFKVKTVVETGTWQGEGAMGFSKLIDNVYTIEINPDFFKETQENFKKAGYSSLGSTSVYIKGRKKITMLLGNSPEVLQKLINRGRLKEPILFFLDAHWLDYWPLLDELQVIRQRPNSLIIIDDVKVPGKPFGYDTYHGKRLDWDLIKELLATINPHYRIFFNEEAAGDYRGFLYAVPERPDIQPGDHEWTLQDYEKVRDQLIKAGLPGEMGGHISIYKAEVVKPTKLTGEEWHEFLNFLKEKGHAPEVTKVVMGRSDTGEPAIVLHPIHQELLKEFLTTKDERKMAEFDVELAFTDLDILNKLITAHLKDNMLVVEVGSWKGLSTSVLAKVVLPRGGQVFAVDHWLGAPGTIQSEKASVVDIYSIFRENLKRLGVWEIVHPLVMTSETALTIFQDGILDFVFIDGDHSYQSVKKDIMGWWRKLKPGGLLCGHDCEEYYSKCPDDIKKLIDESLDTQGIPCCHPGVIKALYDCFNDDYQIMCRIWHKLK